MAAERPEKMIFEKNHARKKGSRGFHVYVTAVTVSVLLLLAVVLSLGYRIWADYRNQIMNNQKEQLLLTSRTLADNMELSLEEYQQDLAFLCVHLEKTGGFEAAEEFFREYLDARGGLETDILYVTADEIRSVSGTFIEKQQPVTHINDTTEVWLATENSGRHLFVFRQEVSGGSSLCLSVDADRCYEKWISGVRIGTSGYIMVKNSAGIILMHPEASQWGIHVISGRKERYPDLDLESLEDMVDAQNRGEEGISEYYSYWWLEQPLVRVRKISGYAPAKLGNDFWVISSVVDYDDFYAPIEKGFSRVSMLFTGSLFAALILLLYVNRLLVDRYRSRQEIATLRELNERLETIHRGEERIGHQQRLQVIGTMTGGIAHEFNNLLTPIMGYSELLMLELDEGSDAYESALEIYDASEKARDVVRQISTLSRRNVETVFKRQDALPLLKRACKMMRSICPPNIRLEDDFVLTENSALLCNSTQISQVLLNLCVNAIHAIQTREDPGEDRILIRAKTISRQELENAPQLENREVPEDWDSYLQIRMEDSGCGMNTETLRQVFNPFFTTKKAGEGTGLGLALAEQIILSHRGFIYAESTPGKGSVFTVCLPLMNMKEEEAEDMAAPAHTRHILIADDNAKILDMLGKNLSRLELDVDICRTHVELKKILEEGNADVLLIDESLEDGSGIDFCMSIQGMYPSLLKIVMTDYPTHTLLEAKQHKIIDGYLLKPVSHTAALEEIRQCSGEIF